MLRLLAGLRRARTWLKLKGKAGFLTHGSDIHIGAGTRLWAPNSLTIGDGVYIGKNVTIECNCVIGNYVLIANDVGIVGRGDHDFRALGVPVRFSPWIGSRTEPSARDQATIEDDVWIGFGCIILSGIKIGRGAIVGAGAVVSRDIPAYAVVTGNPAAIVGERFSLDQQIRHEKSIREGKFVSSERGAEYWLVSPKLDQ